MHDIFFIVGEIFEVVLKFFTKLMRRCFESDFLLYDDVTVIRYNFFDLCNYVTFYFGRKLAFYKIAPQKNDSFRHFSPKRYFFWFC